MQGVGSADNILKALHPRRKRRGITGGKIKFCYSRVYARTIHGLAKGGSGPDANSFQTIWRKTKAEGKLLELLFHKFERAIMAAIPKITGFSWEEFAEPIIYVYPVRNVASFSHPLTIHIRKDTLLTLGILIHELVHNNMGFEFPSAELQEQIVSTAALMVLEKISLPAEPYLLFSEKVHRRRFTKSFVPLEELKVQTVKSYLGGLEHQ